ncbi:hypothetical protein A1O3_06952 [Capronia epimyces CBS 606.96]|uniref:Uncharacterized protein n=1 Tax=Capronia epimyces CBS 606.96 TaxID=1182542 RepID=W9XKB7_9EURO|nr:uncharacterized protein A1O3_06952 [Capronia epimyces CBS 606.96]EXJ80668.1 hypothetical protein A1O3_06952 [Capronia epimyces CBS 606.96]
MRSLSRLPSFAGLVILGFSLVYLFRHGPVIQANWDSAELWNNIAETANGYKYSSELKLSPSNTGDDSSTPSPASSISTQSYEAAFAAPSQSTRTALPPSGQNSNSNAQLGCPCPKPNLVLSAIDGPGWQDQIFIFMQSLELALGEESLAAHRQKSCPPAAVTVKIIVPQSLSQELPTGFTALLQRYPSLEFVGSLPEITDVPVVLRRFQGWADLLNTVSGQYDNVLVCDLDVVFQRNPFAMPMRPDTEILFFAEWRGLKIGQCSVHVAWFNHCASPETGSFIGHEESSAYMHLNRICAGSVYGTARAIAVYMDLMATQLQRSNYQCNDQAMHIHIYYSSLLDNTLRSKGLGRAVLVPNEEALFGSIGTTPMVTFNEWGEILNEQGQVQHAVHQYKTHSLLSDIVWRKYGWLTEVGQPEPIPSVAKMVEEAAGALDLSGSSHDADSIDDNLGSHGAEYDLKYVRHDDHDGGEAEYQQYRLVSVSSDTCGKREDLCSCKYEDCQVHYEWY